MADKAIQDLQQTEQFTSSDLLIIGDSANGFNARKMTGQALFEFVHGAAEDLLASAEEDAAQAEASAAQAEQSKQSAAQSAQASARNAQSAAVSAQTAEQYSGNPPTIIDNIWYIWDAETEEYVTTGMPSRGEQGEQGEPGATGEAGSSIESIERTNGTGAPGTTDTYTIYLTDGNTSTFQVYNGADGEGTGDMRRAIYDPQNKNQDIFQYADQIAESIPEWAKQENKPTYTAAEVGALPDTTIVPTKTSDLENDSGYITGYTETDPTVSEWAKQENKPAYTALEVGAIATSEKEAANGVATLDGNIRIKADQANAVLQEVNVSKTLELTDSGKILCNTSTSEAIIITIPSDGSVSFPEYTEIEIMRLYDGDITVSPSSGVTLLSNGTNNTVADKYTSVCLKKVATNTWILQGNVG